MARVVCSHAISVPKKERIIYIHKLTNMILAYFIWMVVPTIS